MPEPVEIEVKFQIPRDARRRLAAAVATRASECRRLRAEYFDTEDRALARAGLALRIRQEGRRRVQTLKGAGRSAVERFEHEVERRGDAAATRLPDPALHAGTAAGDLLTRLVAQADGALLPLFGTDIRRTTRVLRLPGARAEIAYDVGFLFSGGERLPVHEIEFELLGGDAGAMLRGLRPWVVRHRLWLDVRSKAERGDGLARGVATAAAEKARPAALDDDTPADEALRRIVGASLRQVLVNAAPVADDAFDDDHLHQLRVGLRRLRTALRELADASRDVDPDWEPALARSFARLGEVRDRDLLAARWAPRLAEAGLPPLVRRASADGPSPGETVRDAGFQTLLLALLGFAIAPKTTDGAVRPIDPADAAADDAAEGAAAPMPASFSHFAADRLDSIWRRVRHDAKRFRQLDDDGRHRVRKRLKRLRYLAEFVAPLFKPRRVKRFVARLSKAQDALGAYNDAVVAKERFSSDAAVTPTLWFTVGWIASETPAQLACCERRLGQLMKAERFWH